jgi:hypothetical protein
VEGGDSSLCEAIAPRRTDLLIAKGFARMEVLNSCKHPEEIWLHHRHSPEPWPQTDPFREALVAGADAYSPDAASAVRTADFLVTA